MPGLKLVLDPEESPVELVRSADGKSGYAVMSPLKKTTPQSDTQWASNIDTEGELPAGSKDKNIEVVPKLRMCGRSEKDFREVQLVLERKLNKMHDEGGTLRLYYPDGTWIDYEVRAVTGGERLFDNSFIANWRTEDEVAFVCAPFGEGQEYLAGEFKGSERLLEALIENVPGTAMALARAELSSPAADVWELLWGRQSRDYSSAATAASLYQASQLTPVGGAKTGTRTIEGKAGTPVVKQTLTPNWSGQLSTDLGAGNHLTHVGVFEVLVWISMPTANNGEVGIGLDYGVGDLSIRTSLAPITFLANHPREGKVVRVSLGEVFLAPRGGEGGWQGQINTRSTNAGDELDILAIALRPRSEENGRLSATPTLDQPASLLLRDEFNQTAGALNGKVMAAAQSVTGPQSAGTGASDASTGTTAWANPSGVTVAGGTAATASLAGSNVTKAESQFLKATNFGFALPSTATVEGILFEIAKKGEEVVQDAKVCAVKGGVIESLTARTQFGGWPKTFVYSSYGGASDLFKLSWLYSDINSSGFGVAISGYARTIVTAEIDHVRATVYWTDSAGQKWATSGDAVDITVEATGHTATRSETSDATSVLGRYAVASTTATTDVVAGISAKHTTPVTNDGQVIHSSMARYVDESNWLQLQVLSTRTAGVVSGSIALVKRVAGALTTLASIAIPETTEWHAIRLQIDRRGRYFCWVSVLESGIPKLYALGNDSDLATGGALASGKSGWYDCLTGTAGSTRNYDQFVVWVPPLNAALYEGLGLKLASDGVERQGPSGAWSPVTPEGDYLRLAPAGQEGRKNRLVFVASPHDPDSMSVGFPSELKALVWVTPRYRGVPTPA